MQTIFELAKLKYIQLKSADNFSKLYSKISHSDALNEICGISVRRGVPPTVGDFTYKATMMPSIYFTFDNAKSTMAALIMLKIWDERVNAMYKLCTKERVKQIARMIVAESIQLR